MQVSPKISFLFSTDLLKERLQSSLTRCLESVPDQLSISVESDSFIFPINYLTPTAPPSHQCGAYNSQGLIIEDTILARGDKLLSSLPPKLSSLPKDSEVIDEALYGGFLTRHYGHILTESVSRIWPYTHDLKSLPIVFCGCPRPVPLINKFLGFCSDETIPIIILPQKPIIVKRLYIPQPSMINRKYVHPHHAKLMSSVIGPGLLRNSSSIRKNRILYLSRSKLSKDVRKIANEELLESAIVQLGGEIYHPQEHPIEDQVAVISHAKIIVTPLGSAAHSLLLSPGTHKIVFLCSDFVNPNYPMIDSVLSNSVSYLECLKRNPTSFAPLGSVCEVQRVIDYLCFILANFVE